MILITFVITFAVTLTNVHAARSQAASVVPSLFQGCHSDKVHKKSQAAENHWILSVREFNYHGDASA